MPPNRPLPDIFVTGRPSRSDNRIITPRTPHSRAGRAEEGFTEVELQAYQDEDSNDYKSHLRAQTQPLLSPGYRSRGDDDGSKGSATVDKHSAKYWALQALNKFPLVGGSLLAVALLVSIGVSIKHPGYLQGLFLHDPENLQVASEHPLSATTKVASPSASQPSAVDSATPQPPRPYISYENYTSFPLTGSEYRAECGKMMQYMHHGEYWDLPHKGPLDVLHHDEGPETMHLPEGGITKVCSSSITYMLDGHVGLTADLALMAQAAAFARERGSTFIVDDTHWNRGKWLDYFQNVRALDPGPEPECRAPPPEELVACPRTARHWVISSRTAKYHFGHAFREQYEDPFGHHLNRFKPMFEHAQRSFAETIRPNAHMASLIRAARDELSSILSLPHPAHENEDNLTTPPQTRDDDSHEKDNPALYIGVHIRRGDRIPDGYPFYPDKKIPLEQYVDGARATWDRFFGNESSYASTIAPKTDYADIGDTTAVRDVSSGREDHFPAAPIMWVASDAPPAARAFVESFSSSTAVFALAQSTDAVLRGIAPKHEYVQADFDIEPLEERMRLTRGMIVDLAMVSGLWAWPGEVVPAAVVCGVGSNVCKVSALGFGFERAFGFDDGGDYEMGNPNPARARWVDVDVQNRVVPAWTAFETH